MVKTPVPAGCSTVIVAEVNDMLVISSIQFDSGNPVP
jgi:hypothetical protein